MAEPGTTAADPVRAVSPEPPALLQPRESNLLALQATAGNNAVRTLIQRDPLPNASMPPPNSSQPEAPADPEVLTFEGYRLRFDSEVLYKVLAGKAEKQGIMAPAEFVGRLRNANPLTLFKGSERPGLYQDILRGLEDANLRLDYERGEFVKSFETTANQAATELLDKSKKTIEAELARLGITGDVIRDPSGGGVPNFSLSNTSAAAELRKAASELVAPAKLVDTKGAASAAATKRLMDAQASDPFNLTTKTLLEEDESCRKEWLKATEDYENLKQAKVSAQPSLALYAGQPGAAAKLTDLSTKDDQAMANSLGTEARERLSNIEQVRPEIGKRFSVWSQPHLRRVTLDQMKATNFQREAVEWEVRKREQKAAEDKMFFTLLAIGLGLVAAIPTGGSSLMIGIGAAAAAAGAGLSLYQLGESSAAFRLAVAANATDFDKAKAISDNAPDGMQLALDCVAAVGDVFGAAAAFRTLRSAINAASGGGLKALPQLMSTADRVGLTAASKGRIAAGVLDRAGGPRAVQDMLKALRDSVMKAGPGRDPQFIEACKKAADTIINEGRVGFVRASKGSTLNEIERVLANAGEVEPELSTQARLLAKEFADSKGLYVRKYDIVLLREGDNLGNVLVHELAHRGQHLQKQLYTLGTMRREFQAYRAEQEFLLALPEEALPATDEVRLLRNSTPEDIQLHILGHYQDELAADALARPNMQSLDPAADSALIIDWFKKLGAR